jgi:hypothetical protein
MRLYVLTIPRKLAVVAKLHNGGWLTGVEWGLTSGSRSIAWQTRCSLRAALTARKTVGISAAFSPRAVECKWAHQLRNGTFSAGSVLFPRRFPTQHPCTEPSCTGHCRCPVAKTCSRWVGLQQFHQFLSPSEIAAKTSSRRLGGLHRDLLSSPSVLRHPPLSKHDFRTVSKCWPSARLPLRCSANAGAQLPAPPSLSLSKCARQLRQPQLDKLLS